MVNLVSTPSAALFHRGDTQFSNDEVEHSQEDLANIKYVVTLIHGTWGADTHWTKPDSVLHTHLRNVFGKDSIYFYRFEWKGSNSILTRSSASSELAKRLKRLLLKFPNARHFLIAHSHGGNIAYYTLRESALSQSIAGVICLSTPFLHTNQRLILPLTKYWLLFTLVTSFLITLAQIAEHSVFGFFMGIIFLFSSLTGTVLFFGSRFLSDSLQKKMSLIPLLCPVAVIRTKRDEALILLLASQLLTILAQKSWLFLMHPIKWAQQIFAAIFNFKKWTILWFIVALIGLNTLGPTIVMCEDTLGAYFVVGESGHLFVCRDDKVDDYGVIGLILIGLPTIVWYGYIFGCIALIPVLILATIASIFPFGIRLTLSHIFLEIAIKDSPPGPFDSLDIKNTSTTQSWLKHSKSYEAEESLCFIADWIRDRATKTA